MNASITLLLVDDHCLMRIGLTAILKLDPDVQIIAEADSGLTALKAYKTYLPDIVLLDIRMPEMDGVETLKLIREINPLAKVIMLTTSEQEQDIHNAIKFGAMGYLLKDASPHDIISAIKSVAQGKRIFSPTIEALAQNRETLHDLSPRQVEVLKLAAKGFSNQQIGTILGISYTSVKSHLKTVFQRLDVTNRSEAVASAIKRGVIAAEDL